LGNIILTKKNEIKILDFGQSVHAQAVNWTTICINKPKVRLKHFLKNNKFIPTFSRAFRGLHKRRSQSGSRGFVQYGHFADKEEEGEFFRCGRSHCLMKKPLVFSKFMLCPHGQEGGGG